MIKILALLWALVTRRRNDVDDVDLVPADCEDCGYPIGYCCCVDAEERCTAWSQKTIDQAGRVGGAGERCPERAVASGGSAGGGLPPVNWSYCEPHYEEHLERERDNYDYDNYDYDDYGYADVAR